jgi:hypothetical protein
MPPSEEPSSSSSSSSSSVNAPNSLFSGFYKLSLEDRRKVLAKQRPFAAKPEEEGSTSPCNDPVAHLDGLSAAVADHMVENCIG